MKHKLVFSLLFLALAQTVLASSKWYVDGLHGKNKNDCKSPQTACKTIGHAISLASSGDSIMVAAATYTENLTIGISLKVIGSGASTTIIDGGGSNTFKSVVATSGANVTLSKLTIRNGFAFNGVGGGIANQGTVTINNSTISGNMANHGGGVYNSNPGTLMINNSTISGNSARVGSGINNFHSAMTINNCTISGNREAAFSGSIDNGGTLDISSSTVSGPGFLIHNSGGSVTLQGSIVAHSGFGPGNCYGTVTSNGYNLSSDKTCNFNNTGDLNNTDPKLGQLGYYGGPTQTIPLLSGSPAIDGGRPSGCTDGQGHLLTTDQRGTPRPDKEDTGGCDMGAYERQSD
jgi:hypothetical protein